MFNRTTNTFRNAVAIAGVFAALHTSPVAAQQAQRIDEEYTALIRQYLPDARISTELVDHLPFSDKVPTTLRFPGIMRIPGAPGALTYARDIHRYMKAIADAGTGRAKYWVIGQTEEGRDQIIIAISNEETIANLDTYKGYLQALTDPRRTTEVQARDLISRAKPIYWITSGVHSTERGGPETLMELAYRLVVSDSPFIQQIRDNVIVFITPVVEVDGRERMVDTYYYNGKRAAEGLAGTLGLPYWGKYVAHDNNRDGMGQFLAMTRNVEQVANEWKPTILHDLHESANLLYASTGTGPYNEQLDAITINEWWMFAQNDVMELTKRGVPGVWTYGFYDGWTPNYMFYAVHAHNATGRFYEVQTYNPGSPIMTASGAAAAAPAGRGGARGAGAGTGAGAGRGVGGRGAGADSASTAGPGAPPPQARGAGPGGGAQSREWYRPNPNPGNVGWGPRSHVNMSQSGVLFALSFAGKERERWLENYWIKNRNAVNRGLNGPTFGWVIPATQHSKANAAEAINGLIAQGVEFHTATAPFTVDGVEVKAGDWILRGDQPYRTVADIYFAVQNYSMFNPSPYDDVGWTYPMMRNLIITPINDRALLTAAMAPTNGPVRAAGGVTGTGNTIVVEHTGDNYLAQFRFQFANVQMSAAQTSFEVGGRTFPAGSFIIRNANRNQIDAALRNFGLSGFAVASVPASVPTHDLDTPRIGYIHSWGNTQDEGWVRAALDHYKIPYTYFGENDVHRRDLRAQFDVILWPHGGGVGQAPPTTGEPVPFRRTAEFTALGYPDSTSDTRGGLGPEGLKKIYDFVAAGGTLITEGGTSTIFPTYSLAPGVTVDPAQGLVAPGSVYRGVVSDPASPIAYGLARNHLPVYWKTSALFSVGGSPGPVASAATEATGGRGGRGGGSTYQNISPMGASNTVLSTWDPHSDFTPSVADPAAGGGRGGRGGGAPAGGGRGGRGGGRGGGGGGGNLLDFMRPRVILQFPENPADMLLSGGNLGSENLSSRPQLIDVPIGQGHLVMFSIRPFWRWQTQGTFILGFNSILNWNDLDAGK